MTQQTVKNEDSLVEIRCNNISYDPKTNRYYTCNRLLARLPRGTPYQIKCGKCGHMNIKEEANG